jgi:hypothetical protein
VTPTGAAILRTVVDEFGVLPAMRVERIGYGAGNDRPGAMPNVLRAVLGQGEGLRGDRIAVIETNLDDFVPEHFDYLMERLFEAGALDVSLQHLQMKKNRPGFLLRVLARPADRDALARIVFAESTAIGVRTLEWDRLVLERETVRLATPFGPMRIKVVRGSTDARLLAGVRRLQAGGAQARRGAARGRRAGPAAGAGGARPMTQGTRFAVDVSPFDLRPAGSTGESAAVLCLHGLTGTPYEVRPLAEALVARGLRARGPWMAGHEQGHEALARTRHQDWVELAANELERLRAQHERVFVAGISMGGLVTLRLAQTRAVDGHRRDRDAARAPGAAALPGAGAATPGAVPEEARLRHSGAGGARAPSGARRDAARGGDGARPAAGGGRRRSRPDRRPDPRRPRPSRSDGPAEGRGAHPCRGRFAGEGDLLSRAIGPRRDGRPRRPGAGPRDGGFPGPALLGVAARAPGGCGPGSRADQLARARNATYSINAASSSGEISRMRTPMPWRSTPWSSVR